jgi:hypothetical protein
VYLSVDHTPIGGVNPSEEEIAVAVSANLTSWTLKIRDTVLSPSIVFVSSPTRHVIVTSGHVHTSQDGLTWTSATFPDEQPFAAVWTGQVFVVISEHGTMYTSSDGQAWSAVPNSTIDPNISVVWAAACDGTTIVTVGWGGHIWTTSASF